MSRTAASARSAGQKFERSIADCLAKWVDDRIDIRPKHGAKDRGDIGGWRYGTRRIVVECKNHARLALSTWLAEAEIERGNDDADVALVIHKRTGTADPLDQYVTTTLRDLLALLIMERPA